MSIKVLNPGILTTLQDKGRIGHRNYAVPTSGALDFGSFEILQQVLDQPTSYPALEIFGFEAGFEFMKPVQFAISGAANKLYIDGEDADPNHIYYARQGTNIKLEVRGNGGWISYLGIGGRFESDLVLDSYSTYLLSGIGGLGGRQLVKGDIVPFRETSNVSNQSKVTTRNFYRTSTIRYSPGPEFDFLSNEQRKRWISSPWTVSSESNRMGYRLSGEALAPAKTLGISRVVIPGTVQLPSSGYPIVIMKDGQTTGGYPRIAQILDEDLDRMAQCAPGTIVRFKESPSSAD